MGEGGWPSRAAGPGMWQEVAKVGQIHTEGSSRDHPEPRGGFLAFPLLHFFCKTAELTVFLDS